MKHSLKITVVLIAMFILTQLIGLFVIHQYSPSKKVIIDENGNKTEVISYNLPYGMEPPPEEKPREPSQIIISFIIIFAIAISFMFVLMYFNANILIRIWFFIVTSLAIGISLSAFFIKIPFLTNTYSTFFGVIKFSSFLAIIISLPLAFYKIYKRNLLIHNLTELLIYPGIAAIFVALMNSWTSHSILTVSLILILISGYDMYAVWKAKFMQKMAKYQINTLKIFTGFFVPYIHKKKASQKKSKKTKSKKTKVSIAILGGGDVVFPIILAGTVLLSRGFLPAIFISLGATLGLSFLFYFSEKGKFYPAMPFITLGCFLGLFLGFLI